MIMHHLRHGDRCSRIHNKPTFSQTIVLQNLYINPQNSAKSADGSHLANVSDKEMQVKKVMQRVQSRRERSDQRKFY